MRAPTDRDPWQCISSTAVGIAQPQAEYHGKTATRAFFRPLTRYGKSTIHLFKKIVASLTTFQNSANLPIGLIDCHYFFVTAMKPAGRQVNRVLTRGQVRQNFVEQVYRRLSLLTFDKEVNLAENI